MAQGPTEDQLVITLSLDHSLLTYFKFRDARESLCYFWWDQRTNKAFVCASVKKALRDLQTLKTDGFQAMHLSWPQAP